MSRVYETNSVVDKIKFCREAAEVSRCHSLKILGEYPVGQHTFNMLAMLRILFPEASRNLIWAIIEHDIPERLTGDIPSPTKWYGVIDKNNLTQMEHDINSEIFGDDSMSLLTQEEAKILHGLDITELYMFCKDQIQLGNQNLTTMERRIENYVKKNAHQYDSIILNLFWRVKDDTWSMMPDLETKT